jgi:hypothetical protein
MADTPRRDTSEGPLIDVTDIVETQHIGPFVWALLF